jgi:hypothetical protein
LSPQRLVDAGAEIKAGQAWRGLTRPISNLPVQPAAQLAAAESEFNTAVRSANAMPGW